MISTQSEQLVKRCQIFSNKPSFFYPKIFSHNLSSAVLLWFLFCNVRNDGIKAAAYSVPWKKTRTVLQTTKQESEKLVKCVKQFIQPDENLQGNNCTDTLCLHKHTAFFTSKQDPNNETEHCTLDSNFRMLLTCFALFVRSPSKKRWLNLYFSMVHNFNIT